MEHHPRLERSQKDRMFLGVCGGLAEYFKVDSLIIRIIFVVLTIAGGSGVLIYLLLAILMPAEGHPRGAAQAHMNSVADKIRASAEQVADEVKTHFQDGGKNDHVGHKRTTSPSPVFALIIIALGVYLFFQVLVPSFYIPGKLILAGIIIIIGFALLFRRS